MRGTVRLTDFHLQSSRATFLWGNEIALQLHYPKHALHLVPSLPPLLSAALFSSNATLFSGSRDKSPTAPSPLSQDQLVTCRGETKAASHDGVAAR